MIQMTLKEAGNLLGLSLINLPEKIFKGISIDSRTIEANNLFIALSGDQTDGHVFIDEAKKKGASAALVEKEILSDLPTLTVNSTIHAMAKLVSCWRNQFDIPFVGITGSNGKTTVKNMVASILSKYLKSNNAVLYSQKTYNNHIGVPLTLSQLNQYHQYAVIEMGMNHFGEIASLTQITKPSIAVITNAAACHLEGVGNIQGVAKAKAEIFLGLQANAKVVLNHDDSFFNYWAQIAHQHPIISFGLHEKATVKGILDKESFTILYPEGKFNIELKLPGKHNLMNALAATAVGYCLNIPAEIIKEGLTHFNAEPGRSQLHLLTNGVSIIDDSYNANPFSLNAAVETLATFSGKKILVLADMSELGIEAKQIHYEAGQNIRKAGIDYLFTYGELTRATSTAFGEGAYHFNEQHKLLNALKPFLHSQTTILVKGSRIMKMEKIVAGLLQASSLGAEII